MQWRSDWAKSFRSGSLTGSPAIDQDGSAAAFAIHFWKPNHLKSRCISAEELRLNRLATVPPDSMELTRRSEARRTLVLASLNHAFHDGFTDMIYVLLPVWQAESARCSLVHFRTDSAGPVEDTEWIRMVADLKRRSSTFRDLWQRHNVAWPHNWKRSFTFRPVIGSAIVLRWSSLGLFVCAS
jgi:hypothetical protein